MDQTFRSIVKPDLWGNRMRFRFSNVFGNAPLTFGAVSVGLQEYSGNVVKGTLIKVTFGGNASVTIPPGQEIWSDATALPFIHGADDPAIQGRNLAVSYAVKGASGVMTHHAASNQTSYISAPGSGDHTMDADVFAYEFTTTSWFFLDAVDVMAPAGTVVICAFGDSITDGTHTTLNENDRWMNDLSRRLHNAYGDRVSIVNEAIGGNRVVNPAPVNATAGPAATDRLDRDVLGLSGLTHVIWLEGINDLGASHTTDAVIAGYKDVVARLHAKGVKVYAATLTSALGMVNPAEGWNPGRVATGDNGPRVDQDRKTLNAIHPHLGTVRRGGGFRRRHARSRHRQHEGRICPQQPDDPIALGLSASQPCRLSRHGGGGGHRALPSAVRDGRFRVKTSAPPSTRRRGGTTGWCRRACGKCRFGDPAPAWAARRHNPSSV